MNSNSKTMKIRGFSMIEVLISVVILGFGLLALASLQTAIIRSSSETKAQTIGLQLAKDKIEELRGFQTLTGYQALTNGNDTINDNNGSLGGVNYTRAWTVTRWAYKPSTSTFISVTPLTGSTPTGGTTPSTYVDNNEYKKVAMVVTWNDANGAAQTIGIEDALGAVSPGDGGKVLLNNTATTSARKPKVLIYNPGDTGGVIPIAVGNGSSTAASNPTPVVTGKNNSVAETLFEVLTYAGSSGNVLAQARVETSVVNCTCSTANAPVSTTARGYRPTFWNGYRYAVPSLTTDKPTAGWTSDATQSDRCTACCRDHRDPNGIAGAKFDPWRTTHNHYLRSGSTLTLANTGSYNEACRLIRVDGFFRTAADLRNDYFGLLETNNNSDTTNTNQTLRAYSPRVDKVDVTNDAVKNYQGFVLDYMDDRFSNNTVFNYNVPLATSGYETTYYLNKPVDNSNVATFIPMKSSPTEKSTDSKWSHVRGLYVDWIEPEALDVLKDKYADCSDRTTQLKRNACVLPFVPFTSVNLTELADWTSKLTATDGAALNKVVIQVANNGFYDPTDSNIPTRGNVFAGTNPQVNDTAFAMPYITESNSGVALQLPIDVDEATLLKDNQQYKISNSGGGGGGGGAISFLVNLLGLTVASPFPSVGDNITSNSCTAPASLLNAYTCGFAPDGSGNMQVKVTGYTKQNNQTVPNGCRNSGTTTVPIIVDYNVSSGVNPDSSFATIASSGSDKTTTDFTVLYFKPVVAANTVIVNFSGPTYWCPTEYNKQAVGSSIGLTCVGNGANAKPQWSTVLKTCPVGTPGVP